MAILSPSASGLQKLLNIYASYAIKHDIIYNVKKTQCMVVPSTKFKLENMNRGINILQNASGLSCCRQNG